MNRLGLKILLFLFSIIILAELIINVLNINSFNKEYKALRTELEQNAAEASRVIDSSLFSSLIEKGTKECTEYSSLLDSLVDYKSSSDLTYIYTMVPGTEEFAYFAVDADSEDPADIGEEYALTDEISRTFLGEITSSSEPESDDWGTFISAYAPIKDLSGNIIGLVGVDKDVEMFVNIKNELTRSLLFASVSILIVAVVFSLFFSRGIGKNVSKIRDVLSLMSEGDLTGSIDIKTKDEFGDIAVSVKTLKQKLGYSVSKVKESSRIVVEYSENLSALSEEMAAASREVSDAIDNVAGNTGHQTEEIDNIRESLGLFSEKLNSVTNGVFEINNKIMDITAKSNVSNHDLETLETALIDIVNSFSRMTDTLDGFSEKLSEVFEITSFINNISDQTNLIALNASIEAARAGEAGRGFTVVANEIRKLAEMSKESSQSINALVSSVSAQNIEVSHLAAEMNKRLDEEIKTISQSFGSFKDIILNIDQVSPEIASISENIKHIDNEKIGIIKSIEAVAQKSEEISAASEEISASSEQSSSSSNELAKAAQELIDKSMELNESIKAFRL